MSVVLPNSQKNGLDSSTTHKNHRNSIAIEYKDVSNKFNPSSSEKNAESGETLKPVFIANTQQQHFQPLPPNCENNPVVINIALSSDDSNSVNSIDDKVETTAVVPIPQPLIDDAQVNTESLGLMNDEFQEASNGVSNQRKKRVVLRIVKSKSKPEITGPSDDHSSKIGTEMKRIDSQSLTPSAPNSVSLINMISSSTVNGNDSSKPTLLPSAPSSMPPSEEAKKIGQKIVKNKVEDTLNLLGRTVKVLERKNGIVSATIMDKRALRELLETKNVKIVTNFSSPLQDMIANDHNKSCSADKISSSSNLETSRPTGSTVMKVAKKRINTNPKSINTATPSSNDALLKNQILPKSSITTLVPTTPVIGSSKVFPASHDKSLQSNTNEELVVDDASPPTINDVSNVKKSDHEKRLTHSPLIIEKASTLEKKSISIISSAVEASDPPFNSHRIEREHAVTDSKMLTSLANAASDKEMLLTKKGMVTLETKKPVKNRVASVSIPSAPPLPPPPLTPSQALYPSGSSSNVELINISHAVQEATTIMQLQSELSRVQAMYSYQMSSILSDQERCMEGQREAAQKLVRRWRAEAERQAKAAKDALSEDTRQKLVALQMTINDLIEEKGAIVRQNLDLQLKVSLLEQQILDLKASALPPDATDVAIQVCDGEDDTDGIRSIAAVATAAAATARARLSGTAQSTCPSSENEGKGDDEEESGASRVKKRSLSCDDRRIVHWEEERGGSGNGKGGGNEESRRKSTDASLDDDSGLNRPLLSQRLSHGLRESSPSSQLRRWSGSRLPSSFHGHPMSGNSEFDGAIVKGKEYAKSGSGIGPDTKHNVASPKQSPYLLSQPLSSSIQRLEALRRSGISFLIADYSPSNRPRREEGLEREGPASSMVEKKEFKGGHFDPKKMLDFSGVERDNQMEGEEASGLPIPREGSGAAANKAVEATKMSEIEKTMADLSDLRHDLEGRLAQMSSSSSSALMQASGVEQGEREGGEEGRGEEGRGEEEKGGVHGTTKESIEGGEVQTSNREQGKNRRAAPDTPTSDRTGHNRRISHVSKSAYGGLESPDAMTRIQWILNNLPRPRPSSPSSVVVQDLDPKLTCPLPMEQAEVPPAAPIAATVTMEPQSSATPTLPVISSMVTPLPLPNGMPQAPSIGAQAENAAGAVPLDAQDNGEKETSPVEGLIVASAPNTDLPKREDSNHTETAAETQGSRSTDLDRKMDLDLKMDRDLDLSPTRAPSVGGKSGAEAEIESASAKKVRASTHEAVIDLSPSRNTPANLPSLDELACPFSRRPESGKSSIHPPTSAKSYPPPPPPPPSTPTSPSPSPSRSLSPPPGLSYVQLYAWRKLPESERKSRVRKLPSFAACSTEDQGLDTPKAVNVSEKVVRGSLREKLASSKDVDVSDSEVAVDHSLEALGKRGFAQKQKRRQEEGEECDGSESTEISDSGSKRRRIDDDSAGVKDVEENGIAAAGDEGDVDFGFVAEVNADGKFDGNFDNNPDDNSGRNSGNDLDSNPNSSLDNNPAVSLAVSHHVVMHSSPQSSVAEEEAIAVLPSPEPSSKSLLQQPLNQVATWDSSPPSSPSYRSFAALASSSPARMPLSTTSSLQVIDVASPSKTPPSQPSTPLSPQSTTPSPPLPQEEITSTLSTPSNSPLAGTQMLVPHSPSPSPSQPGRSTLEKPMGFQNMTLSFPPPSPPPSPPQRFHSSPMDSRSYREKVDSNPRQLHFLSSPAVQSDGSLQDEKALHEMSPWIQDLNILDERLGSLLQTQANADGVKVMAKGGERDKWISINEAKAYAEKNGIRSWKCRHASSGFIFLLTFVNKTDEVFDEDILDEEVGGWAYDPLQLPLFVSGRQRSNFETLNQEVDNLQNTKFPEFLKEECLFPRDSMESFASHMAQAICDCL
eukprot:CAMPEP_0175043936 /NCGR_PEP_ID=MMETSP0052_2-20121109/3497_1 /TAXON_ID=51329 ORGANISM="Polytomella parva, Strain SAG 63-3" /NCGR_SAMPLE_ID=MMETSP0052_2 /ASSEMBLY_ACC=CAM_ASM_000194 /LENGTH=1900 /DNA_ID=CAMNT_0016307117 /DNA_START=43 /DNA_END=5745 /DNA_ORIENTATION=+